MTSDKIITKSEEINKTKKKNIQKWPKVAIIILNWNGWKDTVECLESVFRNTYPNYQVIVVDNGSTDDLIEKIKAWAEGEQEVLTPEPLHPLYYLSHPSVKKPIPYIYYTREEAEKGGNFILEEKVTREWQEQGKVNNKELYSTTSYPLIFIQTGNNLGFAGGSNVGIKYALKNKDFNYIWLLNNDTVIEKIALIEMMALGENNKKIGIIGSKILYYDKPNIIQTLGGTEHITWKTTGKSICSFKKDEIKFNSDFEIKGYIYGASLLVKKNVIKMIGLFDENYFMTMEETDFCYRACKNNWILFYNGKSKIWHKVSASSQKGVIKNILDRQSIRPSLDRLIINTYYNIRNHLYFKRKYFNKYFIFFCAYIFIYILRRLIGVLLYDNNKLCRVKILLKSFYDGIKGEMGKTL